MLCGFFTQFSPFNRNALFKKNVSGILCITPAEGLYLPSGGLFFFFLRLGPLKEKDFNIFKSVCGALREDLLGDGETEIYYFKIEKEDWGGG